MTDRRIRALAVLAATAALLAGCAGAPAEPVPTPTTADLSTYDPAAHGNGVALLPPPGARDSVIRAMRAAGAVEVAGSYRDAASGRQLQVSRIGDEQTWTAEVTVDGAATSIVVDEGDAWVRPSPAVAGQLALPAGQWSCVSPEDPVVQRWMPLVQPVDLVTELTSDASGLTAPADGSVDLLLGEDGAAGVLTVATSGPALPSRLVRADEVGAVDVTFTNWGAEPDVTPPGPC